MFSRAALDAALAEALERALRKLLRDHGLPEPISNGLVCGYEVDLHWPEHRLVAELDGHAYHAHRRAFETDRERDIVLAAAGWQTVRVTDHQLEEARAETAGRFTALLTAPGRGGAPPPHPSEAGRHLPEDGPGRSDGASGPFGILPGRARARGA